LKVKTNFVIAEADALEKEAALAVTLAAYQEYEKTGPSGFWPIYRDNICKSILDDATATILLARNGEEIVASVLLCPPSPDGKFASAGPEMRLLSVLPQCRNIGVGGLLIDECERRALSRGVITLHTTRLMETARVMYERRGYVRFPEIDFEPVPGFIVWGYKKFLLNNHEKGEKLK
jgi:GNAT superfamily N-acetyltransferase